MKLVFSEDKKYLFPYWVVGDVPTTQDDLNKLLDIQEWLGKTCGPIGERWGFEKKVGPRPTGGAHYNLRNPAMVQYSWRFVDKADAMHFKLCWDGR